MLAITTSAADAIKAIVAASDGIPEEGGLRIAATESLDGSGAALALELATEPLAGDEVVESEGASVFLEPQAAAALEAAVLDAQIQGDAVSFAIAPQTGESGPDA